MANALEQDPRTMWAYRLYLQRRDAAALPAAWAAAVSDALGPEEHAEFIGRARRHDGNDLLRAAGTSRAGARHLAVRTISAWVLLDTDSLELSPRLPQQGVTAFSSRATTWPDVGWATVCTDPSGDDVVFKTFIDAPHCVERSVLDKGAATSIKRLPPSTLALPLPDLVDLPVRPDSAERPAALLTDWRSAEEAARAHMRANGFPDAELTGGGRDGGIDVSAGTGVAQVKMQALPVGSPAVQQLRGARPTSPHHLFYSTSGFTAAALSAGDEAGVALFKVEADGAVAAANGHARAVLRSGTDPSARPRLTVEEVLSEYATRVRARVASAARRADGAAASARGHDDARARRYLRASLTSFDHQPSFTSAGAAAAYFHHAELLAIAALRALGVPYLGDDDRRAPEPTLEDYYRL